ncbi:MAG: alkaline phosphatase family protein [Propionicimonas sp.]
MPWTSNATIPQQLSKNSPALAAFGGGLHLVHAGDSSNDIWHTQTADGANWTPNVRISDQRSKAPSALAGFGGRLHLVHLGDTSNQLWHSSFDGDRWTANVTIEGESAQSAPALADFGGLLHCVHNGNSSARLYHLTFDGTRWTKRGADPGLDGQRSKGAVALAAFGGLLHMVHQGDSSNQLWHATFDGTRWGDNEPISGQLSKSPPALAAFGGLLHLVHLGDSSNSLWHSTFDGSTWQPNIAIPYQLSKAAPALAAFGNRLHLVHLGDTSNSLWHSSSDGVLVRRPTRRIIVLDLDGLRWDTFQAHLKRAAAAGATTLTTYPFVLPQGASDDTVLGDDARRLHSAFAELCLGPGNGMADVRLALTSYPSFTFPSHATMYTGTWPGRHGIAGHSFIVRDAAPEWDRHSWDSLPRAIAVEGFCTDETGSWGAFWDWAWGGFDQVSADSCTNRNRGLVSDLRVPTLYDAAQEAGLRTCSIHTLYHGADRPWETEGRDQWWHYDAVELRSYKDVCSDDDVDQLQSIDHAALAKASLLLRFRPSTVRVLPPSNQLVPTVGQTADTLDGNPRGGWSATGEAHPDGIPDLITLYLASVDHASHVDGVRNQATYLAWIDHRLARLVRDLKAADPDLWDQTIFALVADHGHSPVTAAPDTQGLPESNEQVVREELLRILLGDGPGQTLIDQLHALDAYASYNSLLDQAVRGDLHAWAEAMNLYVYIREPDRFAPLDVARRLLARAMRTEPYGALVLVGQEYQFLARGEIRPVPLTSAAARTVIVPQLDAPPSATADIDAVSLTAADATAEGDLRDRLNTAEAYDLLHIAERVAGFNPQGNRSMPDVILLAPAQRSFTSSPSTHGSYAYPTSRIPMAFFGPGMPEGRVTIEQASMVDFAPTILSLLGVEPTPDMAGTALLTGDGRPGVGRRPRTAPTGGVVGRPLPVRVSARTTRMPRPARERIRPDNLRAATSAELAPDSPLPVLVQVDVARNPAATSAGPFIRRDPLYASLTGRRAGPHLIEGLTLNLPHVPRWLRDLLDDLNVAADLDLEHPSLHGIAVPAPRFAQIVHGLDGLLVTGAGRVVESPAAAALPAHRGAEFHTLATEREAVARPDRRDGGIERGRREPAGQPSRPTQVASAHLALDALVGLLTRTQVTELAIAGRGCRRS